MCALFDNCMILKSEFCCTFHPAVFRLTGKYLLVPVVSCWWQFKDVEWVLNGFQFEAPFVFVNGALEHNKEHIFKWDFKNLLALLCFISITFWEMKSE